MTGTSGTGMRSLSINLPTNYKGERVDSSQMESDAALPQLTDIQQRWNDILTVPVINQNLPHISSLAESPVQDAVDNRHTLRPWALFRLSMEFREAAWNVKIHTEEKNTITRTDKVSHNSRISPICFSRTEKVLLWSMCEILQQGESW